MEGRSALQGIDHNPACEHDYSLPKLAGAIPDDRIQLPGVQRLMTSRKMAPGNTFPPLQVDRHLDLSKVADMQLMIDSGLIWNTVIPREFKE